MKDFNAGKFVEAIGYKAFKPELICRRFRLTDPELLLLSEHATLKLGTLNAYADLVPDISHFIKLYVYKEATVSSKIEGTQTNMEEAFLTVDEIDPEKKDDWLEVKNYIAALNQSIKSLQKLPLSSRLLKATHKTLMRGTRGHRKTPGEFRKSQNWIGGSTLNNATFIPPVYQEVNALMSDLEKFLHNNETGLPHVIKIAIAHYQFETIHPFLDGNGRIGRLLITLYFIHAEVLNSPVLYLSDFFERNKNLYYDHLMAVRINNKMDQWLKFFLAGVIETCSNSVNALKKIIALKSECDTKKIPTLGRKMESGQLLMAALFKRPTVRPEQVASITGLSLVSSYKLIDDFVKLGILVQLSKGQRNKVYYFKKYFDIFA